MQTHKNWNMKWRQKDRAHEKKVRGKSWECAKNKTRPLQTRFIQPLEILEPIDY